MLWIKLLKKKKLNNTLFNMKLRIAITGLLLGLFCVSGEAKDSKELSPLEIEGQWATMKVVRENALPTGWRTNSKRNEGEVKWVEEGKEFVPELTATGTGNAFHLYTKDTFPVKVGTTVKGNIEVQGQGEVGVMIYLYDNEDRYIGATSEVGVSVPDETKFTEVPFNQKIESSGKGIAAFGRLAVFVTPGSKVQIRKVTASSDEQP